LLRFSLVWFDNRMSALFSVISAPSSMNFATAAS
jgi:hypothetical protein